MSQITYDSEKITKKRCRFTAAATETLKAGYMFCYDADRGTAANEEQERAVYVEKPASGNLHNFAGWLSAEQAGKKVISGDTYMLDIVEPTVRGQKVPVYTDQNCTLGTTELSLVPGQWYAGSNAEGQVVARAQQTVDRSSTNGTVLANCFGLGLTPQASTDVTARSRTTVQLPTAAIWDNIDLTALRANPMKGSLYETDFTHGEGHPMNSYISATYAASAEGKSLTEYLYVADAAIGALANFITTDNQVVEWQVPCPITVSGGNQWGFEARFKVSLVTDTKAKMAFGLMNPQIMSGDILTDAGAIIDGGFLGLHWKEADGDKFDFVYDEASQTQNEHDDDYITPVANTYVTFGMYFNGTTIQGYVDGVATGTAISAVDIAAADFPTAAVLVPTFALKGAAADDVTVTIDWIRVAQG